jgi:hypothetical protein
VRVSLRLISSATLVAVVAVLAASAWGGQGGWTITTFAGTPEKKGFAGDGGPASKALLAWPVDVAVDPQGDLFVAEPGNLDMRMVAPDGTITSVVGRGPGSCGFCQNGTPATQAYLSNIGDVVVGPDGRVYFGSDDAIRMFRPGGLLLTVAGRPTGSPPGPLGGTGFSGDGGPATKAALSGPRGLMFDKRGNLYIADAGNNRVRKVGTDGIITTIAGTGYPGAPTKPGFGGDGGSALAAHLNVPTDLAIDKKGNIYVADPGNYRVRKITPPGIITTVAGTGEVASENQVPQGDGGPATKAPIGGTNRWMFIALDKNDNLYISYTNVIRVVDKKGVIRSFASAGKRRGFSGDGGPPLYAQFDQPAGMVFDAKGNMYVADTLNDVVRKIAPSPKLVLTLSVSASQTVLPQRGIVITVGCNEACQLSATAKIKVVGMSGTFTLRRVSTSFTTAGKRSLTLNVPASVQRTLTRLLKSGKRVQVTITARATGAGGATDTKTRTVTLR